MVFPLRDLSFLIQDELKQYGYTLDDDWKKLFDIGLSFPFVKLFPKDPGLSKVAAFANWEKEAKAFITPNLQIHEPAFKQTGKPKKYAILWSMEYHDLPIPGLYVIEGNKKKNGEIGASVQILSTGYYQFDRLPIDKQLLIERLARISQEKQLGKYRLLYENKPDPNVLEACAKEMHERIFSIFRTLLQEDHFLQIEFDPDRKLSIKHYPQIFPQEYTPKLAFEFNKTAAHYVLTPIIEIEGVFQPFDSLNVINYGMFLQEDKLYLFSPQDASTVEFFAWKKSYRIRHDDLAPFRREFLIPLAERYEIQSSPEQLSLRPIGAELEKKVYLKEVEDYLLFIPAFVYTSEEGPSREVQLDGGSKLIFEDEATGISISIERKTEIEEKARKFFESLHPTFAYSQEHFFSLPIDQVLTQNWFFTAFERIQEEGFEILGLKGLKKIGYSPFRPTIQMRASSGTDWFDIQTEVSFGDQQVKLADIRKALMKKQSYVKLGDGSLGMLPTDWLKKYSTLFKMGKVAKDSIKLSEFQVGLLDEWAEEVDNHQVLNEILEKRQRLRNFREIKSQPLPKHLDATLRNYQREGYNWLHFLDEFEWGGCLADDMGLGKTLQVLAFLVKVSQRKKKATHLVVVPRSLVFNWVREVEKFCPQMKVLAHTGSDRAKSSKEFKAFTLVITTYGLVRSDIEWLRSFSFDYVILDESQAIKNPTTLAAKAVKLLKCRNRLVMTGTPIENNTFDLYSQMDFLNPGMLGSMESFRTEFANPIDKERNEEVAAQLRKLIYPFILSRKKKEVAKELPEKTEIVLYCEMAKAQRKVYDFYRDKFKDLILEKMESEGMSQAGMFILQGLSKLRQICNSPQLLAAEEGEFTQESAKLEVLMEHLEEVFSAGNKVLIFSFFTGMLDLIAKELEKRKTDFVTLTGQSRNREALVQEFKENEDKKVFLISLKAGGFGLNLTEASYVFLVDPWWNPAVEQQAIDRTHRIGQDQQVFAYKMICKDTIEEKILAIQEKKLAVSQDIIHTESGFIKKLSPKDIEGLFS